MGVGPVWAWVCRSWVDLLSLPQNLDDANVFAGRSVCAVDRFGSGRSGATTPQPASAPFPCLIGNAHTHEQSCPRLHPHSQSTPTFSIHNSISGRGGALVGGALAGGNCYALRERVCSMVL